MRKCLRQPELRHMPVVKSCSLSTHLSAQARLLDLRLPCLCLRTEPRQRLFDLLRIARTEKSVILKARGAASGLQQRRNVLSMSDRQAISSHFGEDCQFEFSHCN